MSTDLLDPAAVKACMDRMPPGRRALHPAGPQFLRSVEVEVEPLVLLFHPKSLLERQPKKGLHDHLFNIPVSHE